MVIYILFSFQLSASNSLPDIYHDARVLIGSMSTYHVRKPNLVTLDLSSSTRQQYRAKPQPHLGLQYQFRYRSSSSTSHCNCNCTTIATFARNTRDEIDSFQLGTQPFQRLGKFEPLSYLAIIPPIIVLSILVTTVNVVQELLLCRPRCIRCLMESAYYAFELVVVLPKVSLLKWSDLANRLQYDTCLNATLMSSQKTVVHKYYLTVRPVKLSSSTQPGLERPKPQLPTSWSQTSQTQQRTHQPTPWALQRYVPSNASATPSTMGKATNEAHPE